ncbi:uncharacterized protein LOC134349284 isoform X2 [Mobula hypostoma]|uniref:uncharacterized protein LOC134349284 isoform X2 n=1 Tax=Mobula hypostoma TaxID=723540 RepID=UPI002FC3CDC1
MLVPMRTISQMPQATDDFENPVSLPTVREWWKSEHLAQMAMDMDPSLEWSQHFSRSLQSTLLPYKHIYAEKQNAAKQTTLTTFFKSVSSPAAGSSKSSVSLPSPLAVLDIILTTTNIHLIRVKLPDTTTTTHLPERTHLPLLGSFEDPDLELHTGFGSLREWDQFVGFHNWPPENLDHVWKLKITGLWRRADQGSVSRQETRVSLGRLESLSLWA